MIGDCRSVGIKTQATYPHQNVFDKNHTFFNIVPFECPTIVERAICKPSRGSPNRFGIYFAKWSELKED